MLCASIACAVLVAIVPETLLRVATALSVATAIANLCMALVVGARSRSLTASLEELGFTGWREATFYSRSRMGVPPKWNLWSVALFVGFLVSAFTTGLFGALPLFAGFGLSMAIGSVLRRWPIDERGAPSSG
ncbi:hypothetical protein AB2M62_08575 [Sphingomonas sp. MMS12-HWE2-04]|uniref:hypothetical protein n=1 Tax=Sphingomonas sp. MMS12-HWE2-04 TaxID=3234199 RepID=UPI003850F40B